MFKVCIDREVRKHCKELPGKLYWDFHKSIQLLEKDGCLPEEYSWAGDLFWFKVKEDWVAVAQRREDKNWWGTRIQKIDILELIPASEFQPSTTQSTSQPTLGRLNWLKFVNAFPDIRRLDLLLTFLIAFTALSIFAVGYKYPGLLQIKMGTDGDGVTGEVTVDGRQPQ